MFRMDPVKPTKTTSSLAVLSSWAPCAFWIFATYWWWLRMWKNVLNYFMAVHMVLYFQEIIL